MVYLEEKITKIKAELACSGYLTGWEIKYYTDQLKDLEFRLESVKLAFIPTQLKF